MGATGSFVGSAMPAGLVAMSPAGLAIGRTPANTPARPGAVGGEASAAGAALAAAFASSVMPSLPDEDVDASFSSAVRFARIWKLASFI